MENLEKIEKFINPNHGSGYGSGSGYGDGYGDGSGSGSGYGYGSGDGYGSGYGSGDGSGYGYGDGSGYGYGDGYGDGSGSGSGYGSGYGYGSGDGSGYGYGDGYGNLKKINNNTVYFIDGVDTIILHVKDNIAKGEIINEDFTTTPCYIIKGNGYFAHGKNIKEAQNSLVEKYMRDMNEEDVIEKFMSVFEKNKKYKCSEFFKWHNYLTGSCEMGRKSFMRNHEIKMSDEFTVDEFIDLTINDYGSSVIENLKVKWNEKG